VKTRAKTNSVVIIAMDGSFLIVNVFSFRRRKEKCIVSFVWIRLSSLFVFSVCQLVGIIFLFFCKYFSFRRRKEKICQTESPLYSLQLNPTIDKLVCFYRYVIENVHEGTTLFLSVVSFVWIPLSVLFVFFVCQLVRFLFSCKYFSFRRRKEKIYLAESSLYSL
jgi:hypothetical protein